MPTVKHLNAYVSSPTSEITLQEIKKVIADAGHDAAAQAAEVVRDANGKVIQVSVNLPDTVSQSALDAISNNAGVASAVIEDIPLGYEGFDGTLVNKTLLESQGVLFIKENGATETFNADGTMTITLPPGAKYAIRTSAMLPVVNEYDLELKISLQDITTNNFWSLTMSARNDVYEAMMQVQSYSKIIYFSTWGEYEEAISAADWDSKVDASQHKWSIDVTDSVAGNTKSTLSLDGTRQGDGLTPGSGGGMNRWLSLSMYNGHASVDAVFVLDYIRWTEWPW